MKKNFKTILTSGTLLLGSLALFAGCGSSSSDFKSNIKKEVTSILNNPNPKQKGGHIHSNQLFNIGDNVKESIQQFEAYGTTINNDKVNLSVAQVLGYFTYQISDNSYGVETTVLVNDSKVSKPTKDTFDKSKKEGLNFANNFILSFNYLVDKDNKVTQINDATNNDYFNLQNTGNSIDHYVNKQGEIVKININNKYNWTTPLFIPSSHINKSGKGALFKDQRINDTELTNLQAIWSLPNATYNAALNNQNFKTINDVESPSDIYNVHNSSPDILVIQIGYTENLKIVSGSNQKGVIYGFNADKLSFNELFLKDQRNTANIKYSSIIVPGTTAPTFKDQQSYKDLAFWLDNVKFNVSGDQYWGYSVSSIESIVTEQ